MADQVELLFFDTFAHDNTEEINLDLVQFPKPVFVTEVRIIPLGARVQADFPGGVRLGATNPSQFQIDFFVNDLGKPGASTFETLGGFEYDQNGRIHLECSPDETIRKIPTDGLVLKGWYTTITLAVYGTLTNNITEPIVQPVVNPSVPAQPNTIADAQQICTNNSTEPEWRPPEEIPTVPMEYSAQQQTGYHQNYNQNDQYNQEFTEYYDDVPKDPRGYHHNEGDWESKGRPRMPENDRERDRNRDSTREHGRTENDRRDREKRYSRADIGDRDRRDYREIEQEPREHDHEWTDAERSDYRSGHAEHEWNERDRERGHERERSYKHDENYRRSYNRDERERDERKRPRTPPIQSPKRPHTPHQDHKDPLQMETENVVEDESVKKDKEPEGKAKSPQGEVKETRSPPAEETVQMDVEEFEPILSDEDILDDPEHYQDADYDYSAYTNNDDIIKLFTPGVTELAKYQKTKCFSVQNNVITLDDALKVSIGIADDYFKSSITKYEQNSFNKLNTELKEEFIHLCEKIIGTVGPSRTFRDIVQLYVAIKCINVENFSTEDRELADQVRFIVEILKDWLKIALDYELANVQDQPAYKIRHIKCGVRLAEWCCTSGDFIKILWEESFNIHKELLNLYDKEFMALSIKLMILKALDTYLQHKYAIDKFLLGDPVDLPKENGYCSLPNSKTNGYKVLVEYMEKNPLVRIKFALQSIVKKLNLYELLHKMYDILINLRNTSHDISAEEINLVTKSLNEIHRYCQVGPFTLSQPKRFLPVSSQFEILRSDTNEVLVEFFKMFNLLQCFVLLLTYPSTLNLPLITTPIFEIITLLMSYPEGLEYVSENSETVNVLLKCLLKPDEEVQYNLQECLDIKSHQLGQKIAYKLQALYHVEFLLENGKKHNLDYDATEIIEQLHALYCLTFPHVGKSACSKVLGMNGYIKSLLQFLDFLNFKELTDSLIVKVKKSIGIAYIVDLLYVAIVTVPNVTLLEKHSKILLNLVSQHELFEETVSHKLAELKPYLIPFENVPALTYDNITTYIEMVDKHTENFLYNIGYVMTSLRVIQHLGISPHFQPLLSDNPLCNFIELKYKHVILQLFSLDGLTILSKFLQKICDYYEQPNLHSSIFVSNSGWQLLQIIHPTVLLMKQMLAYVIQCRNTKFKDLTMIPVLLQTYNLLNSYPTNCSGSTLAQEIKANIIDTLLVYTQPISEEISEKDSLNKTLWTQMCGEIIKYITISPHNFISGLLIFSEVLPLPFPLQTGDELLKDEISWVTNLRNLWSAHLHPHSTIIQDMVNKLCISTQPLLLNLLRRICVQIADLAANSAIMIARGILDSVYDAVVVRDESKLGPCNSQTARLLNFLACLVTHNTIKCAVLHLIHTNTTVTLKTDEKYVMLIPSFVQILKTNSLSNSHIQSQECILSIVQYFCDCEISVMQVSVTGSTISPGEYLANALPIKEHLLVFIIVMLDHLVADNPFVTYLPVLRTFLLLTEHDYGFYNLKELLLKKNDVFLILLNKLASSFSADSTECLSTLNTLVEFLRLCVTLDEENEPNLLYIPRSITLSLAEMKGLISWPVEEKPESHPLITLEENIKKLVEENNTFEMFLESLSILLKLLDDNPSEADKESHQDVLLPAPEPLLIQYKCRTIFSSVDACNERLTTRYWLATPTDEGENDLETVACDLIDMCRQNLRPDFNIIKEVEKLCRISATENPDDKEKRLDDDNAKMKKPFVTPMRARGFARTVPQRADLFRSRPPNTSRPPSLHVDDFVALETCGAQPTGPTGYNKISRELLASTRIARGGRGSRAFATSERAIHYRQMPWWGAGMGGMGRGPYQM